MKTRSLCIAVAAGTLTVGFAAPAYAAGGITPATITISAGGLTISAPETSANLGSLGNIVGGGTIAGPLGQVVVTDARSGNLGWTASVIATAFTPGAGPAIPADNVSYTAGTITPVGTAVFTGSNPVDLTGVQTVVTATTVTSTNSATWTPTISVAVPAGMAVNTYTASITHSVA